MIVVIVGSRMQSQEIFVQAGPLIRRRVTAALQERRLTARLPQTHIISHAPYQRLGPVKFEM